MDLPTSVMMIEPLHLISHLNKPRIYIIKSWIYIMQMKNNTVHNAVDVNALT